MIHGDPMSVLMVKIALCSFHVYKAVWELKYGWANCCSTGYAWAGRSIKATQNMAVYCHKDFNVIMRHLPVGLRAWIRTRFIHCWLSAQFDWRAENACILLETIFREPPEIREKLNTVLMKHSRMVGMAHNLGFWLNLELAFLWPFLQLYNNCHMLNSPKFSGQKSENACTYDTEPV